MGSSMIRAVAWSALLLVSWSASGETPAGAGTGSRAAGETARRERGRTPQTRAQVRTPTAGSRERLAILEGLRPAVERELKTKVVFVVNRLAVQGEWAFLYAEPLGPNGKPVDYLRTRYRKAVEAGMFDRGVGALLRKQRGRWRVVRYIIGPTDVAWSDWDRRYGAPKAVLGIP